MSFAQNLHRQIVKTAAGLGRNHPMVQAWLKRSSQQYGCQLQVHPYVWTLRKENRVLRIAPRQFASVPYLASRFDLYFDTLVPEIKGQEHLLDFSRVQTHTYSKPGLTFEFAAYPDEADVLDSYLQWFKPSAHDLVFDIGARCGVFTYILSRFAGRVIAFEADPLASAVLQRNVERHALRNVTIVKKLPALTQAISRYGVPAFCKIDVDGTEVDMLSASQTILSECQTYLSLRTVHEELAIDNSAKVESLLQLCGFETKSDANLGTTCGRPREAVDPSA